MAEGDDDPFAKEYERNTLFEHICAGVLVMGLAIELVNSAIWFEGIKTIAEMFAVSLIVLGVAGEVWFGNRARVVGDKQMAQYRARAAEASQKAAEANLELAKFRQPRSISNEKSDEIAGRLKQLPTPYDVAVSTNDSEIMSFLFLLHGTLRKAGWVALPWDAPVPMLNPWIGPPIGSGFGLTNVGVSTENDGFRTAANKLVDELKAIGIEAVAHASVFAGNAISKNDAIHIWIGRKA